MAPGGIPDGGGMAGAPPGGGAIGAATTGSFFLQPAMASAAMSATRVRFKALPPGACREVFDGHARQSSLPAAGFKDGRKDRDPESPAVTSPRASPLNPAAALRASPGTGPTGP